MASRPGRSTPTRCPSCGSSGRCGTTGRALPQLLDSKAPILGRLARQLPGHYRFTPTKDLADEIEWAKSRRITARDYEQAATAAGREPPIPVDLFVRTFEGYERAKVRAGRIDFDDLLLGTVDLLEGDAEAAATIRARKRWFSVDEYQDTSPLQQRLLELWLGESRDLCVVGDEDQTIYSFTGATPEFLTSFAERWPGATVVPLVRNYRSTPQVLELANRLIAAEGRSKRLLATRGDGPVPTISRHPSAEHELAALVTWIQARLADGVAPAEVAVLVRMNAQLAPIEEALTRAGVAYQVRGMRFYDRAEVRSAVQALRRPPIEEQGAALRAAVRTRWTEAVGYEPDGEVEGDEARERQASLETLLAIVDELAAADPAADGPRVLAELEARAAHEREGSADGVNLLTYHRAKGLEWDAVFLPSLEEGILPIRQAKDADDAIAEERRLLYVGITRARVHLALSWAERRETRGREGRRQTSRFLLDLRPRPGTKVTDLPGPPVRRQAPVDTADGPVFDALRAWRTGRARTDAMPPYVIAHDATLRAIADANPRSLAALNRVKGMGPQKVDKYGDEILAVLAAAGEAAAGEAPAAEPGANGPGHEPRPPAMAGGLVLPGRGVGRPRPWRCVPAEPAVSYFRTRNASSVVRAPGLVVDDLDRVQAGRHRQPGDDPPDGGPGLVEVEPALEMAIDVDLHEAAGGELRGHVRDLEAVRRPAGRRAHLEGGRVAAAGRGPVGHERPGTRVLDDRRGQVLHGQDLPGAGRDPCGPVARLVPGADPEHELLPERDHDALRGGLAHVEVGPRLAGDAGLDLVVVHARAGVRGGPRDAERGSGVDAADTEGDPEGRRRGGDVGPGGHVDGDRERAGVVQLAVGDGVGDHGDAAEAVRRREADLGAVDGRGALGGVDVDVRERQGVAVGVGVVAQDDRGPRRRSCPRPWRRRRPPPGRR